MMVDTIESPRTHLRHSVNYPGARYLNRQNSPVLLLIIRFFIVYEYILLLKLVINEEPHRLDVNVNQIVHDG